MNNHSTANRPPLSVDDSIIRREAVDSNKRSEEVVNSESSLRARASPFWKRPDLLCP